MLLPDLSALVFSWLLTTHPPDRFASIPTYPEAQETSEERTERYLEIANDIAEAALEHAPKTPKRAAALLYGIAWHESGFAKDVDLGPCAPARLAKGGCDSGRAKSLWQIQGYTLTSRKDAARLALRLAKRSFQACRALPEHQRLASYAAGTCLSRVGQARSEEVWTLFSKVLAL